MRTYRAAVIYADPARHDAVKKRDRAYNKKRWADKTPRQREAANMRVMNWIRRNRVKTRATRRAWHRARREQVLVQYGGKCACCGESRYEFLTIDHIKGGGRRHRAIVGNRVCYWLGQQKRRLPGFRVLCMNCNWAIGLYEYCPHASSSPARSLCLATRTGR